MSSIAVCLGRFQPLHKGHLDVLKEALETYDQTIVVVGSAFRARTPRNPFTWEERQTMIRLAFSAQQNQRLHIVPLRDYFDVERWSRTFCRQIQTLALELSVGCQPRICLFGDLCTSLQTVSEAFLGWNKLIRDRRGHYSGSQIRHRLFQSIGPESECGLLSDQISLALKHISDDVHPSTLDWLGHSVQPTVWSSLANEWRAVQQIKHSWQGSPFPPTFVTVDSVVRCDQHVLLIRRGGAPGVGLLALPGGFVEQNETIEEACIRELGEETCIQLSRQELRLSLAGRCVFDYPFRSLFGRVITHGHYFELQSSATPAVRADDDAASAHWVPIADLYGLEDQFHDDHFFILDHFLKLLP